jgi:hypothetical protein
VVRLPLLLAHSLSSEAAAPVELFFDDLDFGGSFKDLVHDRLEHGSIGIGISFEDGKDDGLDLWTTVQDVSDYGFKVQVVSDWSVARASGFSLRLRWTDRDPLADLQKYDAEGAVAGTVLASFKGLVLDRLLPPASGDLRDQLGEIRKLLTNSLNNIAYLGPFRQRPERSYRLPGRMPRGVGHATGRRAPDLLFADIRRRILPLVADWFKDNLGGWSVDLAEGADGFQVVLRRSGKADAPTVNLVDVGQGMNQVLPLVVQRIYDAVTSESPAIEIIEQPELHLHPAVHGAIADLYVLAAKSTQTRFLIETHSEVFCLRLRRRIAMGELRPDQIIIYSVEDNADHSVVRPIHILPDGEVDYWPKGVFSEDFAEAREIRSAQRAREGNTNAREDRK